MLLEGRACLVTGAAGERSIGRAAARLFAEHGARVAILDLDERASVAAASDLPGYERHAGYSCNVTDLAGCKSVAERAHGAFGRIDVVVNCAGVAEPTEFLGITRDAYDLMLDVNLRGTFHVCQAVMPFMVSAGAGSIINLASVAAQRGGGLFGGAHYCAAKGGVLSLTKALAREYGPKGIRANAICPSLVETAIHGDKLSDERRKQIVANVPLGRVGQPSDIAGVCLFLASDLSAYVTGAEIDVNGGSHIH
ncbi:SDR family NAD(P)-dependent oxidoreductase [Enterovirga sp. CN4-39]|uniref:SDR family NAD(P)-dependent oxidoreductase n=1 Tax=Enterovirga sp. CN4-39 TaxID=3400910 RepID=UPI003C10D1B2